MDWMGGHGGLNILPQKRWNVYNFDNREKVRRDEEAAAADEQLKREQSRRRDSELRLQSLRVARNIPQPEIQAEPSSSSSGGHINLFEGIKILDPVEEEPEKKKAKKNKKEEVVSVSAEDEKYRLGYGVAGKGVKLPWYLEKRRGEGQTERETEPQKKQSRRKKTVEELREERLRREKREKERERALLRNR